MSIRHMVVGLAAVALAAPFAGAEPNAGPPRDRVERPPAGGTKFKVEFDGDAREPKLFVPAGLVGGKGDPELARAEPPPFHWVLSGLALTAGLSLGGVWLVRKGAASGKRIAWIVAPVLVAASATLLFADLGPIRPRPRPVPSPTALPAFLDGTIAVEVVPGGDTVRLVLDKASWEKFKKDPVKPEGAKGADGPKKGEE